MKKVLYQFAKMTLKVAVLITIAPAAFCQQEGIYLIGDGLIADYSTHIKELSGNRTLMVKYSRFGWDSTWVSLVWLNQNINVVDFKSHRLTNPITFLFDVETMSNGILMSGVLTGFTGYPFLARSDTSGNIFRVDHFQTTGNENIHHIVKRPANLFTCYSSSPYVYAHNYRIDGSMIDTNYTYSRISAPTGYNFRMYDVRSNGAGKDIYAGQLLDLSTGGLYDNFLMQFDATGTTIDFVKSFDFFNYDTEICNNAVPLSNGNILYTTQGYNLGSQYPDGFIGVMDVNGNHVWAKQFTSGGAGFAPSSAIQLASDDVLIFGNSYVTYEGILIRITPAGNVVWKKRLPNSGGIVIGTSIQQLTNGKIALSGYIGGSSMVWYTTENGASCGLVMDTLLTVTPVVPNLTNIPSFTISPFTVNSSTGFYSERSLTPIKTDFCVGTSIYDLESEVREIVTFPNPTSSEEIQVNTGGYVKGTVYWSIFTMPGNCVKSGIVENLSGDNLRIDISGLNQGSYYIALRGDSNLMHSRFIKLK